MFTLEKTFSFESSHMLSYHDGKCKRLHGHSYILKVILEGGELQKDGPHKNMLMDFHQISGVVKPMIQKYFDHHYLNDTLESDSPTAEWIAQWIYHHLAPKLPLLKSITLYETATASVTYCPPRKKL